jgi:glycosyltransferase involved in cell wall biosynthesis
MLEAMHQELPIVASKRDGMAEILPAEWLFPYGESGLFVDAILNATTKPQSEVLLQLRQRVQERHSLNAFRQGFLEAVKASLQVIAPVTAA